ncbi:TetR/AcrR family transcriptional regulator [Jatrophihabitans fulvus]
MTRPYRGLSADARREQRRATLVRAVTECLDDEGLAGVSVRSVCARARLTPRYFYESFADLDELLVAAVDAVTDEVAEKAMAAVLAVASASPDDTEAQVRAAIRTGYGIVADDQRKANVLLVSAAGHGPLRERRQKVVTEYADLVIDGLPMLNRLGLAERRTARATALFLMGGSADVIEAVLAGRLRMSRAAVVDHLVAMWLGALGTMRT